jgi:hypothetical protein
MGEPLEHANTNETQRRADVQAVQVPVGQCKKPDGDGQGRLLSDTLPLVGRDACSQAQRCVRRTVRCNEMTTIFV